MVVRIALIAILCALGTGALFLASGLATALAASVLIGMLTPLAIVGWLYFHGKSGQARADASERANRAIGKEQPRP